MVLAPALFFALIRVAFFGAAIDSDGPTRQLAPGPTEEPSASSMADRSRRTAIYWVLGVGTPVGFTGLEAVRRLGDDFEISAGFGGGAEALASEPHPGFGHVLQWAVMPRLRFGNDESAFTIGAGVSGGNYADPSFICLDDGPCPPPSNPVSYVLWNNFEIAGEHWNRHGVAARAFAGYAHGWCVSSSCETTMRDIPYFGIGVGYAF